MIIIIRKDFIGIWKLISIETQTVEGELLEKFNWIGRLRYDEKGYISVQLMELNRPHLEDEESLEDIKNAFEGFNAYFGTYNVDDVEGSVTHHVEGSMYPNWTNTDLKRFFKFDNNKLELTTTPMQQNDNKVIWRLIWERLN